MTTAERQKREYDRFGPWLVPVESSDDISDAFRERLTWDASIIRAFKIPRKVERRNTHAGADLYDFLAVLYPDRILLLDREDPEAPGLSAEYQEIAAVEKLIDLLKGELILHLTGSRKVTIPFNSVSEEYLDEIMTIIEEKILGPNAFEKVSPNLGIPFRSHLYINLLNREQKKNKLSLVTYQPAVKLKKESNGFWHRLIYGLLYWSLRESMIASGDREIVVYQSIPPLVFFPKGNYGYTRTLIPRISIESVTCSPSPVYHDLFLVTITARGENFTFPMGKSGIPAAFINA